MVVVYLRQYLTPFKVYFHVYVLTNFSVRTENRAVYAMSWPKPKTAVGVL